MSGSSGNHEHRTVQDSTQVAPPGEQHLECLQVAPSGEQPQEEDSIWTFASSCLNNLVFFVMKFAKLNCKFWR